MNKAIKIERFALIIVGNKEIQSARQKGKVMVPLYKIPMMTDKEWEQLAAKDQKERLVI